jgi:hypothetical protein
MSNSAAKRLNYTDITQNTYIQSWMVTEIMAREKCGRPWGSMYCMSGLAAYHTLRMSPWTAQKHAVVRIFTSILDCVHGSSNNRSHSYVLVKSCKNAFCVFPRGILWHAFCVWILWWQCTSVTLVLFWVFLCSLAFNIESWNCRHTQHKLSKRYNLNIRVVSVYNMYCITLSQNLSIRVLIVYLHFSNASDHECMLPTNVLPSTFHRETLQST